VTRALTLAILTLSVLCGCAASPRRLCATLVTSPWEYIGDDTALAASLRSSLPRVPYQTNEGKPVRAVRHIWYRAGDQLLACTLARHARDDCSVRTTQFARVDDTWSKTSENAVLCNVTAKD
jgi:hypothetical protein